MSSSSKKKRSKVYYSNLEEDTLSNQYYRKVVHTIPGKMQLVLMNLRPGEEIGEEVHPDISQFFRIEKGLGVVIIENKVYIVRDGDSVIVPPGKLHNVKNISSSDLRLYTIYTPPEHPPGTIQLLKKDLLEFEK